MGIVAMSRHTHHLVDMAKEYSRLDGQTVAIFSLFIGVLAAIVLYLIVRALKDSQKSRKSKAWHTTVLSVALLATVSGGALTVTDYFKSPNFNDLEQAVEQDLRQWYDFNGIQHILPYQGSEVSSRAELEALWVHRAMNSSTPPAGILVKANDGSLLEYGVHLNEDRMQLVDLEDASHSVPASQLTHEGVGPRQHYIPRDYFDKTALGEL